MINLLPPSIKEQLTYARWNHAALSYVRLTVLILVVLAGVFGTSIYFLQQQTNALAADVKTKKAEIANFAPKVADATAAAERLAAIKTIQDSQTRFSLLLDDLAKVLPQGVSIDSITLTGDDKNPVRITITGNSYNSILAFRDAFAQSPRLSGVDLDNINQADNKFSAGVVIGFKPGQAR
jgi:Tfp pilus assembly protein PilN